MYTKAQQRTMDGFRAKGYQVMSSTALKSGSYRVRISKHLGAGHLTLYVYRDGTYRRKETPGRYAA